MSDNKITNKILDNFDTVEELKDYASAQFSTILEQSKKISRLEKELESIQEKLIKAEQSININSALSPNQDKGSDAETTCLVQLAIIKANSMSRELTLEETKKLEILTKTLILARGKTVDQDKANKVKQVEAMSTEELLKMASEGIEQ